MLRRLRIHLTVLCTVITSAIVLVMTLSTLYVSETQLKRNNITAFQSNINTIVHKLQNDSVIGDTWLAQTEASEGLIIHIEDQGHPLAFSGAWTPQTERKTLITQAQEQALKVGGVNVKKAPLSAIEITQVIFELKGKEGELYQGAVALISGQRGYQSLTLLRDMSQEEQYIFNQRVTFCTLGMFGIAMLCGFSWWFSGRAIQPIEESRKKQTEFIAAASHELRSPLAVIQASASAIDANDLTVKHFTDNIESECKRMARLVDDLLLLAGTDAKTWSIEMQALDTDTLLIETVELFYPLAKKKNQKLVLKVPDSILPKIKGDFQRLQQVLSILIDNALSYTQETGQIEVCAYLENNKMYIAVKDNGSGIPEENKIHIFDRFYRVDKSRNAKNHFGLGLSIAKELMELHGGKLYLEPGSEKGCTFTMEFPRGEKYSKGV